MAGRIMSIRNFSKFSFLTISNIYGSLQLLLSKEEVSEGPFEQFFEVVDIGDFIEVEGRMYSTKTNEKTLRIECYVFLGKALRPLPEKWHGLSNVELRYRQRYLDLMMTKDTQSRMLTRTKMVRAIRRFFEDQGFLEVETPVLQHTSSGAIAQPFKTFHNALDTEFNLRIAPETYLKRFINAYSELVDPLEQRRRLEAQALLKSNGDSEAMEMDEDYLVAMEYGMPPISGWGFGIERLIFGACHRPNPVE